jgi:fructose-1,6-bisphosphatase
MKYNQKYYHDNELWQLRPKRKAINIYTTEEGLKIGMFQGKRGQFPNIDYVVKILKPEVNGKLIPPPHSFWVVDLMMKIIEHRKEVIEILEFYADFYNTVIPFNAPEDRENHNLETVEYITQNYSRINQPHTLSINYVAIIIELFCKNEKRNDGAYMFRDLLQTLLKYAKNEVDYMTVIIASQPGFR